jgi:hypothetical protein
MDFAALAKLSGGVILFQLALDDRMAPLQSGSVELRYDSKPLFGRANGQNPECQFIAQICGRHRYQNCFRVWIPSALRFACAA